MNAHVNILHVDGRAKPSTPRDWGQSTLTNDTDTQDRVATMT